MENSEAGAKVEAGAKAAVAAFVQRTRAGATGASEAFKGTTSLWGRFRALRPTGPSLADLRQVRWGVAVRRALIGGVALGALYYGVLGALAHNVDNDPTFRSAAPTQGGSAAVDMAAALVQREVVDYGWTANDPLIAPTALLDNTPNFQLGMMRAIGRFTFELLDQIARTRGSSSTDPDLERANGLLQFPGDIWIFEFEKSWLPTIPSEDQYLAGQRALVAYNQRLAAGQAVFERRPDVLAATLSRIAADLGSQTAQLDRKVQTEDAGLLSARADDVFFQNKGTIYAYFMLLDALGQDFEPMIRDGAVAALWQQALESLRHAASLNPSVVINGSGDDSIFANHLVLQGFYMKRAILQIEEIVSVLRV